MYLREMGSVPLLTREGETEIARRIERGQNTVMKALSRSPLVIQEILDLAEEVRRGTIAARDVVLVADPLQIEEAIEEEPPGIDRRWPKTSAGCIKQIPAIAAEAEGRSARPEAQAAPPPAVGDEPHAGAGFAAHPDGALPKPGFAAFRRAIRAAVEELTPGRTRNAARAAPHRNLARRVRMA